MVSTPTGRGNGTMAVTIAPNDGAERVGAIAVAGERVIVRQGAMANSACTAAAGPDSATGAQSTADAVAHPDTAGAEPPTPTPRHLRQRRHQRRRQHLHRPQRRAPSPERVPDADAVPHAVTDSEADPTTPFATATAR